MLNGGKLEKASVAKVVEGLVFIAPNSADLSIQLQGRP